MSEQTTKPSEPMPAAPRRPKRPIGGIVLIIIGALLLANNLWPAFDAFQYWPLILVAIGLALLLRSR